MGDTNFTQLTRVKEAAYGVIPASPNAQKVRMTGESFKFAINTIRSEEMRSDRQLADTVQIGARANGGFGLELSYGSYDPELSALFVSLWNGIAIEQVSADTEITDVDDASDTITVASGGGDFVAGHLVYLSGFTPISFNPSANAFATRGACS